MGHLIYGVAPAINIDDWTLHHLRSVIVTKLRRDESFVFSWGDEPTVHGDDATGGAATGQYGSVWISKASSLYFSFERPLDRPLNRRWLTELAELAASSGGLRPVDEPADD
ncbi:DUF7882 family protein [Microbacterium oleivorans]|uniref:DUF7882 family protein n=1 Tax=Microbacterium oleivorans TaxID=273677 RepID=UPI00203FFF65|nr:hypothetical protein [Microbacterium oleivorans]MCM3696610.1 hypothetical protein [Microbacterium oleivorans]